MLQNNIVVKKYNNSKGFAKYYSISGFAHLFLLVVTVLVAIGGLLYFSWQKGLVKTISQQEVSPTPTTDSDANQVSDAIFANWKTYTNFEHGFSLKYPPDWERHFYKGGEILFEIYKAGSQASKYEFIDAALLKVTTAEEQLSKPPEDLIHQKAFEYEGWKGYRGKPKGLINMKYDYIIATKSSIKNEILGIEWQHDDLSNNGLNAENFLFPILSTFKFLDKNDNGKLRICPDMWVDVHSCMSKNCSLGQQILIEKNGVLESKDPKEFDLEWIKNNCEINEPEDVG